MQERREYSTMRSRFERFDEKIREILQNPETDLLTFKRCLNAFKLCFSEDNKRDSRVLSEILTPLENKSTQILRKLKGRLSIQERKGEIRQKSIKLKNTLPENTKK